jgi:hypothetical protein
MIGESGVSLHAHARHAMLFGARGSSRGVINMGYSRAGATDSFTGILEAPNARQDFVVSKAVGIPLEM